jgi:DNA-binding GntR family transcriptional regulator
MIAAGAILREGMADRVRRILLERILEGAYPPGTRLVELQIARELNVSQAPVREALRELEAARIVETEPYRGTRVRRVSPQEQKQGYQVRGALEELAAQLGSARLREKIRELRAEADASVAAAKADDVATYVHHTLSFHRMIVEASGNSVLVRTWDSLTFSIGAHVRGRRATMDLLTIAREHQQIAEALGRGDGRLAGRLLRRHAEALAIPLDEEPAAEPAGQSSPAPGAGRS